MMKTEIDTEELDALVAQCRYEAGLAASAASELFLPRYFKRPGIGEDLFTLLTGDVPFALGAQKLVEKVHKQIELARDKGHAAEELEPAARQLAETARHTLTALSEVNAELRAFQEKL